MGKKIVLSILLLVLMTSFASAATYYVDATMGNDNNNGLSESAAWQTLGRIANSHFQKSDDILFKRGETFTGSMYTGVVHSGTASDPVIIGAYGTGPRPIISTPYGAISLEFPNLAYITIQDLDVRNATLATGIGAGADNMSHITISRINVDTVTTRPCIILFKIDGYIVENSTLSNCGNAGIAVTGTSTYPITNGLIRNNVIHDIWSNDGITLHRGGAGEDIGRNHLLINNTVYNAWLEEGFDLTAGDNVTVRDCETYNNTNGGISIDHFIRNVHIDRHYSHDDRIGIVGGQSTNVTITNSVIENYRYAAFALADSITNFYAYHNTIIAGSSNPPYLLDIGNDSNMVFKNNIFTSTQQGLPGRYVRYMAGTPQSTNSVFENNIWWRADGGTTGDPRMWYDGVNLLTFNQWRALYPADKFADPKLVDPANYDLHLQAGSPAIDNGTNALATYDFSGAARPQGAGYDIGAYEYFGSAPPPSSVPGDLDGDGDVDVADLSAVALDFGKTSGFLNSKSDTNKDGIVDIFDVVYVASRIT